MKLKNKKEIFSILLILLIQTIIFVIAGMNKYYLHMDEAYSLGLASYDKVEIQNNENFYNEWHNSDYYEDYLSVQEDEVGKYGQVYENQKNDVHPPLYYLFLRIAMGFNVGHYSKWPGIVLNIIIYLFITVFMYLILEKLFEDKKYGKKISLLLAFTSSVTLASITSAIYIRMYALTTLNVIITTYLHLKLLTNKENNILLYILVGISALVGSLTHYYYLFYLAMLALMYFIKYIREKDYKNLIKYITAICSAGVVSILIFPYSINHMFFGYRGQGVISNLLDIKKFISNILVYIIKLNKFAFNKVLLLILIIVIIICKIIKKKKLIENKSKYIKYITLPTIFYFVIVAIASPWIELRYIMPICGIVFVLVMYFIEELLCNIVNSKNLFIILTLICVVVLAFPILHNRVVSALSGNQHILEPEVAYSDKKEIVNKLENELNLPTLFLFNSSNNRFLDDILLFAKIDESYIAKDLECSEENIKEIMKNKDCSNGIIVFINEGQNNDELLGTIKNALNLEKVEHLKRLNACDVYIVK